MVTQSGWISEWSKIDPHAEYIVCPINQTAGGELYLGQPIRYKGWQVRRLTPKCYAAILMPPFVPSEHT